MLASFGSAVLALYLLWRDPAHTEPEPFLDHARWEGYDGRHIAIAMVDMNQPAVNRYFEELLLFFADPHGDGSGRDDSLTRLWVRDDPPRPLDFAALTALADIFFPRVWLRRAKFVPIGTVSMTVYFHADAAQLMSQRCHVGCCRM